MGPKGAEGALRRGPEGARRAPWAQGALRAPWGGRLRRRWGPWGRWNDFEIIPNGYLLRGGGHRERLRGRGPKSSKAGLDCLRSE